MRAQRIALLTGGPSQERGISLNSARSFLDHTEGLSLEIEIFYLAPSGVYYLLTPGQIYSNTPADFDFKMPPHGGISVEELIERFQKKDLVVPLIHGIYGEDGTLQALLEAHHIPYLGSSSRACHTLFHKARAKLFLQQHQFPTIPGLWIGGALPACEAFWHAHCTQGAILKPVLSGSSVGVRYVPSLDQLRDAWMALRQEGFEECLLEPYCTGTEFTLPVIQNATGEIIALPPIEVALQGPRGTIFDYRRKYLPTEHTRYFCPPRFASEATQRIQHVAKRLFALADLADIARMDGWLIGEEVCFSDFNLMSGMEQNSFLFQSAAHAGLSHRALIRMLLQSAFRRSACHKEVAERSVSAMRRPVYILTGGSTAERQVALMSGTNVWLKLLSSDLFSPQLFLLDFQHRVWPLSYARALHHTVEEILAHLAMDGSASLSLETFLEITQKDRAFLFLALHGGLGEDGTLQQRLEGARIPFNGSGSAASALCMNKARTAQAVAALQDPQILSMSQYSFQAGSLFKQPSACFESVWRSAVTALQTEELLIKPQSDGCSAGVVRLRSAQDLARYVACLEEALPSLPGGTLSEQDQELDMPRDRAGGFLLEPYIFTDRIQFQEGRLLHTTVSGWVEMTVGLLEEQGHYHVLNPSITVALGRVLSLEEKFQGGTGINLTPPPESVLAPSLLSIVKGHIEKVAKALGIQNYARIDVFVELATGKVRVIEANTLPALTPSTVFYHQAWSEVPPLPPKHLLEKVIQTVFCDSNI